MIKLLEAGSLLFRDWKASFYCSAEAPIKTVIDFGGESKTLKGKTTDDVVSHMRDVIKFLDTCSKDWKCYIDKQRQEYYHLNYFTTDQLVILQQELAKLAYGGKSLDSKVYPMLECLIPSCTEKQLSDAIKESSETLDQKLVDSESVRMSDNTESEKSNRQDFIERVQESGYSFRLAIRAMQITRDPAEGKCICPPCMQDSDIFTYKCVFGKGNKCFFSQGSCGVWKMRTIWKQIHLFKHSTVWTNPQTKYLRI